MLWDPCRKTAKYASGIKHATSARPVGDLGGSLAGGPGCRRSRLGTHAARRKRLGDLRGAGGTRPPGENLAKKTLNKNVSQNRPFRCCKQRPPACLNL
jgi:hypothetical protein